MYQRKDSYESDLLETQTPNTSAERLYELSCLHHGEIDIISAISTNPSCALKRLARLWLFNPELVEKNPAYNDFKNDPVWHSITASTPRTKFYKWRSDVNERWPEIDRVIFILENGDGAYQRWAIKLGLLPDWLLIKYASSKSAPLRKSIADRKTAPREVYEKLAKDSAKTVRQVLASNQQAPAEVLGFLVNDSDSEVANAARSNPACPEHLIQIARLNEAEAAKSNPKSLNKGSFKELLEAASSLSTPNSTLDELSSHSDPRLRFLVGLNKNIEVELLERLANDAETWVRACTAFNPNTPPALLEKLIDQKVSDVQLGLASNPSLSEQLQLRLAKVADNRAAEALANLTQYDSVWKKLAEKGDASKTAKNKNWRDYLSEMVQQLEKNKFSGLTQGPKFLNLFSARMAARHEKCPDQLAKYYATYLFEDHSKNPRATLALLEGKVAVNPEKHQDWKVDAWFTEKRAPGHVANFYIRSDHVKRRTQAVSAPSTQVVHLLNVTLDPDTNTRKRLAERIDLIRFMFEILATDEKPGVREQIAKNKKTPKVLLEALAADKATTVRTVAAKRVPQSKVAKQSSKRGVVNQGSATERGRLAKNAENVEQLLELANDKAASVRAKVAEHRGASGEILIKLASDPDVKVRRIVALRCRDKPTVLKMLDDDDRDVRINSSKNNCFRSYVDGEREYNPDFLAHIAEAKDPEIRAITAGSTADEKLHEHYMKDSEAMVLKSLALNKSFSESRKLVLAEKCSDHDVLGALINKTTNEELFLLVAPKVTNMQTRANDAVRCNREMLARPKVQDALCVHPTANIRWALTGQTQLTETAVRALLEDPEKRIQEGMARRYKR